MSCLTNGMIDWGCRAAGNAESADNLFTFMIEWMLPTTAAFVAVVCTILVIGVSWMRWANWERYINEIWRSETYNGIGAYLLFGLMDGHFTWIGKRPLHQLLLLCLCLICITTVVVYYWSPSSTEVLGFVFAATTILTKVSVALCFMSVFLWLGTAEWGRFDPNPRGSWGTWTEFYVRCGIILLAWIVALGLIGSLLLGHEWPAWLQWAGYAAAAGTYSTCSLLACIRSVYKQAST